MSRTTIFSLSLLLFSPAAGRGEEAWMVWADYDCYSHPIVLARYDGTSWPTEELSIGGALEENYGPALAVSPAGELLLAWAARAGESPPRIYFSRRSGETWTAPVPATSGGAWEETAAIASDQNGDPWIAWSREEGLSTEVFYARGGDNGFEAPVRLTSPDASPDSDPAIACGKDGRVLVAWAGWANGRSRIFYRLLTPSGWTGEEAVFDSPQDQILPAAFFQNGVPGVSWREEGKFFSRLLRRGASRFSPAPPASLSADAGNRPAAGSGAWLLCRGEDGAWRTIRSQALLPSVSKAQRKETALGNYYYTGYGDSITYGHSGGSDTNGWYGSLLRTMLQSTHPGDGYYLYNEGYPAAETGDLLNGPGDPDWPCPGIYTILARYPAASKILIMGGTNDVSHGKSLSGAYYNLWTMIDRSRGYGVDPILATVIPRCDSASKNANTTALNQYYIIPLAGQKNCTLADAWQEFIDYGSYCSLLESDGLHPRWSSGDQRIANGFYDAVSGPTPIPTPSPTPRPQLDYDCDGYSDIAVFRPSQGLWVISGFTRCYFGASGDLPAPADFNGDGRTEIAIWRPSTGMWSALNFGKAYLGSAGDIPCPADFNGDGVEDAAIFRPSSTLWSVRNITRVYFGSSSDLPVPADYNGDGIVEVAVFRPAEGLWSVRNLTRLYFGGSRDYPVPEDFNGDGRADFGTFRPDEGLWSVRNLTRQYYGGRGDLPQAGKWGNAPAESDAIFRGSQGLWARSGMTYEYCGSEGDLPVGARLYRSPIPPTPTPNPTASPSPTTTPVPTASPAPSPSPVPTASPSPSPSPLPTASATPTPLSPTPSPTPTQTPTCCLTPTPTP